MGMEVKQRDNLHVSCDDYHVPLNSHIQLSSQDMGW